MIKLKAHFQSAILLLQSQIRFWTEKGDWESTEELEFQTSKQNKQKQKLKELKFRAQKALNLVEIIGLDLQLLKLKDPNSTDSFSIDFSTTNPPNPQPEHGSVASP